MNKKKIWQLKTTEVISTGWMLNCGGRKTTNQSREFDSREFTLKLLHIPTKVDVTGKIPMGHYTRKKLKELREKLYKDLFSELEKKVAKVLHISGR